MLVEFDGDVHRDRDVFVNDLRRQNQLVAEGWVVLRFTSADVLGRPDEVIAEIRRALLISSVQSTSSASRDFMACSTRSA